MAMLDSYKVSKTESTSALSDVKEDSFSCVQGEIFYTLEENGSVQRGHFKNVVTLDAGILLGRLFKGPNGILPNTMVPRFAVLGLAVGTGDLGWNPLMPPPATNTQRSLYNEIGRKAIINSSFIDGSGSVTTFPTRVIDITVTFGPSEAVGSLVEMGLIGGDANSSLSIRNPILPPNGAYNASVDVTGKDCLVNYATFPVISKSVASTLSFTWRLTF